MSKLQLLNKEEYLKATSISKLMCLLSIKDNNQNLKNWLLHEFSSTVFSTYKYPEEYSLNIKCYARGISQSFSNIVIF